MRIPRITILILTVIFFGVFFSEALGWALSVPLPGYGNFTGANAAANPSQYIKFVYAFSMGFGALLAIVVIIIGAVRFTVSEAIPSQEAAREQIMNAIWGLMLLLGAYVIGTTINPKIDPINPPPLPALAPLPKLEICGNGQNDDGDNYDLDSTDPDCASAPPPSPGSPLLCASLTPLPSSGIAPLNADLIAGVSGGAFPIFCYINGATADEDDPMLFHVTKLQQTATFTGQCSDQDSSCSLPAATITVNPVICGDGTCTNPPENTTACPQDCVVGNKQTCFKADVLVATEIRPDGTLVGRPIQSLTKGDVVIGAALDAGEAVLREVRVLKKLDHEPKQYTFLELASSDGTKITATDDHPIVVRETNGRLLLRQVTGDNSVLTVKSGSPAWQNVAGVSFASRETVAVYNIETETRTYLVSEDGRNWIVVYSN